ncbi:hypothetical protein C8233_17730 [Halomonas sp. SF2003]|nr:hypothetical protein C8233_17730 [Halomonas sp. SF2003]
MDEKHAAVFISKIISMRRREISLCRYQIVVSRRRLIRAGDLDEGVEIAASEITLETQKASHRDWPFASVLRVTITRLA